MCLSKYVNIYPSAFAPDSLILFSSKNAAIVEIPKSHFKSVGRMDMKDLAVLKRTGFLVASRREEREEMLGFIEELNRLNKTLSIKVVMTLDCNLACRYCFEGTRKGKFYMARETADELIGFIEKMITSRDTSRAMRDRKSGAIKEIHLTFYGGEPLLSKGLILYIAGKVKALAKTGRMRVSFFLQTNGTLLTKKTATELKPLGLREAIITLDGPRENHDASRPYKSGRGSFDRIVGNMKEISKIINVQVGGNFTKDNYHLYPAVLDFLTDQGLTSKRIRSLGFYPVVSEKADVLPDLNDGCGSVNEPWFVGASQWLREEILKRGFGSVRMAPGVCMMEYENNLLVNYNGDIYKCPGMIGRREYCIGNIRTGIKDYRRSHNLDNWKNDECLACSYLPLCFGGCRYMKYIRDGSMDGVDCKKPFFDATLEAFVKQDIKYGLVG